MKEVFLEKIDHHQGIIHKITFIYANNPEDRKDLFQDIVYQLWKAYPTFEKRAAFSTWIYKVALNTALLKQSVFYKNRSCKKLHSRKQWLYR
jgi:RNA polymerase sigma-70 factor (ECF subfamily)